MIPPPTSLKVADNTGAKAIMCSRVPGGAFSQSGSVGRLIVTHVQSETPDGVSV